MSYLLEHHKDWPPSQLDGNSDQKRDTEPLNPNAKSNTKPSWFPQVEGALDAVPLIATSDSIAVVALGTDFAAIFEASLPSRPSRRPQLVTRAL